MATPTEGINLRVTAHCSQGGRKYMEDFFQVAYEETNDHQNLSYTFFGIFDGHGGQEAAKFAKDNLMTNIIQQESFWSDKDSDVLKAIRDGFVKTQLAMWHDYENWPKTSSGLPSTSGTTASVAFIRKDKLYIGHVGDSSVVLGYQVQDEKMWKAQMLTEDHKPECASESERIRNCGGRVVVKSGVPRIVWNRPRMGHSGPVRRSTQFDEIPFLAVARSLGDLWSYNAEFNTFVVSPVPDVSVMELNPAIHRCLIFATDGLWNMLNASNAVELVQTTVLRNNEQMIYSRETGQERPWINPSKKLVEKALEKWKVSQLRADNTSAVTILLNPCGPPRGQVLVSQLEVPVAPISLRPNPDNGLIPGQVVLQPAANGSEDLHDCNSNVTSVDYSEIPEVVTFTRHAIVSSGMEYEDTSEVELLEEFGVGELPCGKSRMLPKSAKTKSDTRDRSGAKKVSNYVFFQDGGAKNGKPTSCSSKESGNGQTCLDTISKNGRVVASARELPTKCFVFRLSDRFFTYASPFHRTQVGKKNNGEVDGRPVRRLSDGMLERKLLGHDFSPDKANCRELGVSRNRRSSEGAVRHNSVSNHSDENDINKLNPKHCKKSSESSPGNSCRSQGGQQKSSKAENHLLDEENYKVTKSTKVPSSTARSDRTLRSNVPTRTLLSRNVNANSVKKSVAQDVKNKRGLSPSVKMKNNESRSGVKEIPRTSSPLRKRLRSSDCSTVRPMVTRSQANRRHSK